MQMGKAPKLPFRAWFAKVDAAVAAKVGIGVLDLPDYPYRDWYDDGVTPAAAAARAVRLTKADYGYV